jgi:hypothetical protein
MKSLRFGIRSSLIAQSPAKRLQKNGASLKSSAWDHFVGQIFDCQAITEFRERG